MMVICDSVLICSVLWHKLGGKFLILQMILSPSHQLHKITTRSIRSPMSFHPMQQLDEVLFQLCLSHLLRILPISVCEVQGRKTCQNPGNIKFDSVMQSIIVAFRCFFFKQESFGMNKAFSLPLDCNQAGWSDVVPEALV